MKKEPSLPITKLRKEKNWNRISDEKGNRVNITKIVIRNYEHMQRNGCSRRNLQIIRYIQFIKTESGKIWKLEQANKI